MAMNLETPTRRKSVVSLTPLIDVVFILLLFFMLTTSFIVWRTVDTPIPTVKESVEKDVKKPIIFVLKDNSGFFWSGKQKIPIEDGEYIRKLIGKNKGQTFVLQTKKNVQLQSLLTLADQLKLQGAEKLSIANAFDELKKKGAPAGPK